MRPRAAASAQVRDQAPRPGKIRNRPRVRTLQWGNPWGIPMLKAILWFIAIVFIIGLLVVFGVLDLIF